jgi:hypothetical protein
MRCYRLFSGQKKVRKCIENDGAALISTMSAARAWRAVLQTLNDSMVQSFSGVLSGNDPEDLHAFRVAVRRIRTILQDGDDVVDVDYEVFLYGTHR